MTNKSKNQIELYSLGKCKDNIISILEADPNIVSLVLGEYTPTQTLKDKYVFDSLAIDLYQGGAKTYITMDSNITSIENKSKCIKIKMNVFTHISLIKLSPAEQQKYYAQGFFGNRIDVLLDNIYRNLIESNKFGIGGLELREKNSMSIIQPNTYYYGKYLIFHMYDF